MQFSMWYLLKCYMRLSLFLLAVNIVDAVPAGNLRLSEQEFVSRAHLPAPRAPFANTAHLRDSIIDTIWRYFYPSVSQSQRQRPKTSDALLQLYTQYADQLVLRFNVSTPGQAASLAEAADVLFLDTWAAAENWVDIRLPKDVVCGPSPPHVCLRLAIY